MKKYSVILADPPWQTKAGRPFAGYKVVDGIQIFSGTENKSRELEYPTMTVEEICALPIKDIIEKHAHLYMWVTNQYMHRFNEVLTAWGFKYSTVLTWTKNSMGFGLGGTFGINTEHLIFATRGSLKSLQKIKGTHFHQKRPYVNGKPKHSKKPPFFIEMIESVSPGNKLELFAREEREGWDSFGNEIQNSVSL